MPRGLSAAWKQAAKAGTLMPFFTVRGHFDSGTRRFWDGPVLRNMLGGLNWEGGAIAGITPIGLRSEYGAARVEVTISGLQPTNLAQALGEDFYGRRAVVGRGFFEIGTGLVLDHAEIIDGIMVQVRVTQHENKAITWKTVIEVGSSRGRQAVGRRRTQNDQRRYATYLRNSGSPVDNGFQFVTGLRKPVIWPAAGYQPPDLRIRD